MSVLRTLNHRQCWITLAQAQYLTFVELETFAVVVVAALQSTDVDPDGLEMVIAMAMAVELAMAMVAKVDLAGHGQYMSWILENSSMLKVDGSRSVRLGPSASVHQTQLEFMVLGELQEPLQAFRGKGYGDGDGDGLT